MVTGSKECEGSLLSLIADGWLLTELHRRRWELNGDGGSLIATMGAQRRRLALNGDGGNLKRFVTICGWVSLWMGIRG